MQGYLLLYKSKLNNYYNLEKYPESKLLDLYLFFSESSSLLESDIFIQELNLYYTTYIYNDFKNNMMYVGFGEWFIDEDIDGPSWDEYSSYVNEYNSCKITVENFKSCMMQWKQLKKDLPAFALIYRDDSDWIECKGFNTQKEMELFVKNPQPEVVH